MCVCVCVCVCLYMWVVCICIYVCCQTCECMSIGFLRVLFSNLGYHVLLPRLFSFVMILITNIYPNIAYCKTKLSIIILF